MGPLDQLALTWAPHQHLEGSQAPFHNSLDPLEWDPLNSSLVVLMEWDHHQHNLDPLEWPPNQDSLDPLEWVHLEWTLLEWPPNQDNLDPLEWDLHLDPLEWDHLDSLEWDHLEWDPHLDSLAPPEWGPQGCIQDSLWDLLG